jgi:hypothetical protein
MWGVINRHLNIVNLLICYWAKTVVGGKKMTPGKNLKYNELSKIKIT